MKKIEYVWRELLIQTIEQRKPEFQQQQLAKSLGLSSSTVNLALSPLRRLGAISIGKRHSEVIDYEKILYHWANHRNIATDIVFSLCLDLPVREIEGRLPSGTIPTVYTAVRERFGEPPSEYAKVYCYHKILTQSKNALLSTVALERQIFLFFKQIPTSAILSPSPSSLLISGT